MDQASNPEAAGEREHGDTFGVLVGWTHTEFNGRLDLRLQTLQSTRREADDVPDSHHFMMTRSQAAVLANYLYQISGQTPPIPRKRGWLRRMLGR
jgi:hypothetical protein